jgi:hypothetical protein
VAQLNYGYQISTAGWRRKITLRVAHSVRLQSIVSVSHGYAPATHKILPICRKTRPSLQPGHLPSSMRARTVVEGLFGLQPRVDQGRVQWAPRFPADWDDARLTTRGFPVQFSRQDGMVTHVLESEEPLSHELVVPAGFVQMDAFTVNGEPA